MTYSWWKYMIYVIFQITFLSSRKGKQKEVNVLPFFLFPFSFLPSSLPPSFPFLLVFMSLETNKQTKNPEHYLCISGLSATLWYTLKMVLIFLVVVVQLLSHVQLFATPWTAARQTSLSFTISWRLLKFIPLSWCKNSPSEPFTRTGHHSCPASTENGLSS